MTKEQAAPDLLEAAKKVLAGLHERIANAPKNAVPVGPYQRFHERYKFC